LTANYKMKINQRILNSKNKAIFYNQKTLKMQKLRNVKCYSENWKELFEIKNMTARQRQI
jgi:hypothetical protein